MKKILGLDLGTNSIGWAVVNEAEADAEQSSIVKIGVRTIHYDNFVNSMTAAECRDAVKDFCGGKSISCNASRTKNRGMRRRLQRYKLRRERLIKIFKENNFIDSETILCEEGKNSTYSTYRLRSKAVAEEISLSDLAKVLLMINKKRGYKSSRKAKSADEGEMIDGMQVAKLLMERNITPGEYSYQLLKEGKKNLPAYYRSDLRMEFNRVWDCQKEFYPDLLTNSLLEELDGKNSKATWAICANSFKIEGAKRNGNKQEQKLENYKWRSLAVKEKLDLEQLTVVFQELNSQINNSSGYLGAIGDRSKELIFSNSTVGQHKMRMFDNDPNYSFINKVYYRQDYQQEVDAIWNCQAQYHNELTLDLKRKIVDDTIFYQRPLRSQKNLISFCEFESREIEVEEDGKKKKKTIGLKVCPKSSPLFQEFKIWQIINNLVITDEAKNEFVLTEEQKALLFDELNYKEKMSSAEVLSLIINKDPKKYKLNFDNVEGNRTNAQLLKAYQLIVEESGNGEYDFSKMKSSEINEILDSVFGLLGINKDILSFDSEIEGKDFEKQKSYLLWHLLYSYEGDDSPTGNQKLVEKLESNFGFSSEYGKIVAQCVFEQDYGSLSAKAMRKIIPFMKSGSIYSDACELAGYRHSKKSLTKEELAQKIYKDKLEVIKKNSLRNPVVEKILNQMVNVVNQIIETYGKPDEIRIELSRELKKSIKERKEMSEQISASTKENEDVKAAIQKEFPSMTHISRNDIIRYKLYLELACTGFKTLYTNTYIPREKVFSKEFDIEHIIPKAKLFDDSFSNKTLEARQANIDKKDMTALDYVATLGETAHAEYKARVEQLYKDKKISKSKYNKLLMAEKDIPSGFIDRDLRDSQYIAKKARTMLEDVVKFVVPTTGSVTDRLREDWGLLDIMKELNKDKYEQLGLVEYYKDKDGRTQYEIKDWTKRNDNRHHAMDALTIAFTKRSYINYLNNLNARIQKSTDEIIDLDYVDFNGLSKADRSKTVYFIEKKYLRRNEKKGKLMFVPPFDNFREEAKKQLENVLISVKARNKVVTINKNTTKKKVGTKTLKQQTPRGPLHNETIYGSMIQQSSKLVKVGASFDEASIERVCSPIYREALRKRLAEFGNDPKKAFTGKNSLVKNPIYVDETKTEIVPESVKIKQEEVIYTKRAQISPDLKLDKIIDKKVKALLEARLKEFGGNAKLAFSDLEQNPIYLNKEKGITIKRVTITAINVATPLHPKRDKLGNLILDAEGQQIANDFVSTGNNHHVAIFRDDKGKLQEHIVSFFEATTNADLGLPIIDRNYNSDKGWKFLFTMKQNEYFVFPNEKTGFNPNEIDLMDPDNYAIISPNLFRVQKLATRNYFFRHHLETTVEENKALINIAYKPQLGLNGIEGIVKVRINHIGQIVQVGEY